MHVSCLGVERHHFPRRDATTRVDVRHLPGRWAGTSRLFVIQWAGAVVYTCGGCGLVGFLVRRRHMPNGHRGVFGGGQMAAPGCAMRVGGAPGRFVWVPMRPLGARPPGALPTAARGTLGALRAWLYAVCSNPQLLPVHIPEPRWCFHAHPGRPRRLSETPGFNPGLILA